MRNGCWTRSKIAPHYVSASVYLTDCPLPKRILRLALLDVDKGELCSNEYQEQAFLASATRANGRQESAMYAGVAVRDLPRKGTKLWSCGLYSLGIAQIETL